jgi:hypothetical protein
MRFNRTALQPALANGGCSRVGVTFIAVLCALSLVQAADPAGDGLITRAALSTGGRAQSKLLCAAFNL